MRFSPFRATTGAVALAAILLCSCEEHHPGEYPEVQRDRLHEARQRNSAEPVVSPTPIKFFPENRSG